VVVAFASNLHRLHNAIVIWRERASLTAFAIAAGKARQSARRRPYFRNFRGSHPDKIKRVHFSSQSRRRQQNLPNMCIKALIRGGSVDLDQARFSIENSARCGSLVISFNAGNDAASPVYSFTAPVIAET
jgi:hypothetical protein